MSASTRRKILEMGAMACSRYADRVNPKIQRLHARDIWMTFVEHPRDRALFPELPAMPNPPKEGSE